MKALAHPLNPVVIIGQAGLTPAVLKEINVALDAHELIKIRIRAERDERNVIGEQICADTQAVLVQSIGQVAVIYRKNPKK
nr:YhbY family RNA-binding protein [Methylomonas sp. SURF-2]